MYEVEITGAGMVPFGKFPNRTLKELAAGALDAVIDDAGIEPSALDAAYVGNSVAGIVTGQEAIRGQTILHAYGIGDIPVFNVENACASSSSAIHLAWQAVAGGFAETALVLGVEKLYHPDRAVSYRALGSAVDIEEHPVNENGSPFLQHAAEAAESYLEAVSGDARTLAEVAAKSHRHGSLNPYAQYRTPYTTEEILESPAVAGVLTRLMCAPIGDGAAALVLSRRDGESNRPGVRIAGTAVGSAQSGTDGNQTPIATRVATRAFDAASIGPLDVDVAEIHDTTAFNELRLYEQLGFFARDSVVQAVAEGRTELGGRPVVNPSGGLVSRGHPVGATGAAQLVELTWQLRGTAGDRQVEGARVALAQNGGGRIGDETAALAVTLLERVG